MRGVQEGAAEDNKCMIGYRESEWARMKESFSMAVYMLMPGTHCRQTRLKRKVPDGMRMIDANAGRNQSSERRCEEMRGGERGKGCGGEGSREKEKRSRGKESEMESWWGGEDKK